MSKRQSESDQLAESLVEFFHGMMAFSQTKGLNQLAEQDLTFTQVRTLLLASAGSSASSAEPLAISEIADSLGMSITAASRGVDGLVRAGLLTRRTSEDDRRVKLVTITEKGSELLSAHRTSHEETVQAFVASLPAQHIAGLSAALQPIISDPEFAECTKSVF